MDRLRSLLLLLALSLSACAITQPGGGSVSGGSSSAGSSISSQALASSREGVIQKAGVGIVMQGTHKLVARDGSVVYLESTIVSLDTYIDAAVLVSGRIRPTVEGNAQIMTVETIEIIPDDEAPMILEETTSSAVSSRMPSSSSKTAQASSAAVMSTPPTVSSAMSSLASSSDSVPPASSAISSITSTPSTSSTTSASVNAMAKVQVNAANFTGRYCTTHIGFCVPVHRNWYYQSFGANVSPFLWHVEVSDQSVEEAGQGVIVVNLVSGPMTASAEASAEQQGSFVVAQRQWTGNRHFAISAPAELKAAVEYMAANLSVTEQEQ